MPLLSRQLRLRPLVRLAGPIAVAIVLPGCGSAGPSPSSSSGTAPLPGVSPAEEAHNAPSATTASTSAAEPNTGGTPSFVVNATTQEGDTVKVEGWFGPTLPASESDVDQSALSECPAPAPDGRAIVVRLDLTTTLESSIAGQVGLETSYVHGQLANFVMGYSQGAQCELGEPNATSASLGTIQPGQSSNFTMWIVLPDAITPDNPHPSEKSLAGEGWFIEPPQPTVNGSGFHQDQHNSVTGPRVVQCENTEQGIKHIAVIGGTPYKLTEQNTKDYSYSCGVE
jgi:hypothetical protein